MKKKIIRTFTIVLIILMLSSTILIANADIAPQASLYINSISSNITVGSGGKVTITGQVLGTGIMDTIGVSNLTVQKYQSGSWVDVDSWSDLYDYNCVVSTVEGTYYGTANTQYRAVITFYAGVNGYYDTRIMTTRSVTALN